jgi:nucleoside-diphosphate-sugar epimerase
MKAFVTGGSGFIGRHLLDRLVARGADVTVLARSDGTVAALRGVDVNVVRGDILDVDSMRDAMRGADVVFHLAAWYEVGAAERADAVTINVGGTRKVLSLAHELGVPRIVYTSSVTVFGDTHGQLVDETYVSSGPFLTEYDRTKWLAHYKVVLPLIERGAPIMIALPGEVYGPGDTSLIGQMMRRFYHGRLPFVPGSDGAATYAHVVDVADGLCRIAEQGRIGESYILAGPPVPLGEMVEFWSMLTGQPAPSLRLPSSLLKKVAPLVEFAENFITLPPFYSAENLRLSGVTYTASAARARAELGWRPRPLQAGMLETFDWIARTYPMPPPILTRNQKAGLFLLGAAALGYVWRKMLRRREEK